MAENGFFQDQLINYEFILSKLKAEFGNRDIRKINQDDMFTFLNRLANGNKQNTKRNRFTTLSAFFNFVASTLDSHLLNPCEGPLLKKMFNKAKISEYNSKSDSTYPPYILNF